eukprot:EG_transcript_14019
MSALEESHKRPLSSSEEAPVPRTVSAAGSDLPRTISGTLPASLEHDLDQLIGSVLSCLTAWAGQPPTAAEVHATRDMVARAQVAFVSDVRRAREAQQRLLDQERELRTQVANLWQNNAALEKEMRYLAGELDLTQRKCRTLEKALDKQSGRFQTERDGLVQGTRGHQTAIQQLEAQIRDLSDQLAERERLLHSERAGHWQAATVAKLHQLEAREQAERHTVAADFHEGLRLLSAQALRPTWAPPPTPLAKLVADSPRRGTYPLLNPGPNCVVALSRHEQTQRLSETLSALRLRIEGGRLPLSVR